MGIVWYNDGMKRLLETLRPEIYRELVTKDPTLTTGSNKRLEWMCPEGHTYEAQVNVRTSKNTGCPYCSGRLPITGVSDLGSTNPRVADMLKDQNLRTTLTGKSNKTVEWLCPLGHTYKYSVSNMVSSVKENPCVYCSNGKTLQGFNDLDTTHPDLADELVDQSLRYELRAGSPIKVEWNCSGHTYTSSLVNRTRLGSGCPFCSGNKVLPGYNDLATTHPELAKELTNQSEGTTLLSGSSKKVSWKCSQDHIWDSSVANRVRGKGCGYCSGRYPIPGETDLATTDPDIYSEMLEPALVTRKANKVVTWVCPKGHEWDAYVYSRTQGSGCPVCSGGNISKLETDLSEKLKEIYPGVVLTSDKTQIKPLELDIYFPDLNVAVEFNGMYFHSEKFKPRDYHRNKLRLCQEKGIKLIQIWEDDYLKNPDLVLRTLSHKLGVSVQDRTPARKTYVSEITYHESRDFLEKNHLQGQARGTYYLGLRNKSDDSLVAVTVLKRTKDILTLERYSTSRIVVGGQTKLLSYVDKNIPYEKMYTFADLEVSSGNLYETTGWIKDKVLPPDYKYLYQNKRVHKFNFRKNRFKENPNLMYDPSMSESQLAQLNGLLRIWDSGKIRYVRTPS